MNIALTAGVLVKTRKGYFFYFSADEYLKFHNFKKYPARSVRGILDLWYIS